MTTKLKLLLETSSGEKRGPITEEGLQCIFDNLPENTGTECGTKLAIALCLYGLEDPITQALGRKASGFVG